MWVGWLVGCDFVLFVGDLCVFCFQMSKLMYFCGWILVGKKGGALRDSCALRPKASRMIFSTRSPTLEIWVRH